MAVVTLEGDTNGLVYEWLSRFASNPELLYKRFRANHRGPLARVGNEQLLVNTECVIDCWDVYMSADARPKSTRIGKVLDDLSHQTRRLGPRHNRNLFHVIQPDLVLEWCRRHQIGNEEKISMNLRRVENFDRDEATRVD